MGAIIKDVAAGKRDSYFILLWTKDQKSIPVEARFSRTNWGGQDVIIGLSRNNTERKQIEQEWAHDLDAMTRLQTLGMLSVQEGNLEPILTEVVDAAIAISGADFGNIQMLNPTSGDLQIVSHRGFPS